MTKTIKILKLVTGEEILSEIEEYQDNDTGIKEYKVIQPVRIAMVPSNNPNPNAGPQVGFAPWAQFSSDKNFHIASSHVLAIMEPIPEFSKQYASLFSQIIPAKTMDLILPVKK